jgi:ABC-type multidrug transport system fused ATPase/permease subunit
MIKITEHTRNVLLEVAKKKKVYIEGNFLKILKAPSGDTEFEEYLKLCKEKDTATRRKRMDVAKEVQQQNKELEAAAKENASLMKDLKIALEEAENSKAEAEKLRDDAMQDLELLQQKTQFELIGQIVKVALFVIVGVGLITSLMYGIAIVSDNETEIIGPAWSNMFSILLTNAFSIVGTIMGVKYATEKEK